MPKDTKVPEKETESFENGWKNQLNWIFNNLNSPIGSEIEYI